MKTTDWKYDFSSLPRWDNRDKFSYVYDDFVEIPQSDALCCIYSINEASMCNYIGFLAILKNKNAPELFLNVSEHFCFCDNISVSKKGDLIFLQPSIYSETKNAVKRPILIINIWKGVFSFIKTDNCDPGYKVVEAGDNIYTVEPLLSQSLDKRLAALSRKRIRPDRLKWRRLDEINSLPTLVF